MSLQGSSVLARDNDQNNDDSDGGHNDVDDDNTNGDEVDGDHNDDDNDNTNDDDGY